MNCDGPHPWLAKTCWEILGPLPLTTAQWPDVPSSLMPPPSVLGQSKGDTWDVTLRTNQIVLQSTRWTTSISSQSQRFRNMKATFIHGHGDATFHGVGWCAANADSQPLVVAVTGHTELSSVHQRLAITVNLCGPASPEWTLPFQQPVLSARGAGPRV